jgi:putative flippase GtrA
VSGPRGEVQDADESAESCVLVAGTPDRLPSSLGDNTTVGGCRITTLYQRWRHLVHELARFGIVGAVNTVLDFGLANLLYLGLGWPSLAAKTASVAVAATSSYFMNRHWTFRHRARTGLRREYTLFFLLNGVGLLISDACILIVERGFDKTGALWFNLAQVAGLALGMVFRFTTYKRWVFVSPERAAARTLAHG